MTTSQTPVSRTRTKLLAAVASLAIAGAVGFGAVTSGTAPVLADAVRIQAPQAPGFADVVEKVSPAVVSVQVKSKVEPAADRGDADLSQGLDQLPENHPLRRFFRDFKGNGQGDDMGQPRQRHGNRERGPRPVSQGSGFFISEDGYLVTNNHVVDGGTNFTVVMDSGDELDAKLIGTDPRTDLAVLKVDDSRKFTYVDFADDSKVRVGDWVVAVGNPFGLGGTVTAGIVSARGRDIGAGPYDDFLQIDAAVNRGNSGGPAFNLSGEVVGINTAIFSPSGGGNVGIAFAIPASTAKVVVGDLMKTGNVSRGWLGVQIQPIDKDIADSLGLASAKGAIVSEAQAEGPAIAAGIKAGDVITAINGKEVASPRELAKVIGGIAPGQNVDVTLWRDGKAETVKLELGTLPGADKQASAGDMSPQQPEPSSSLADLGLTVAPADDGKGIVVTDVDPDSDASDRGIQAGDVITTVNAKPVKVAADVTTAMDEAAKSGRKAVLVQVTREDANRFVALPVARG